MLAATLAAGGALASSVRPIRSVTAQLSPAEPGSDLVFVVAGDNRPTQKGAPLPRVTRTLFEEIGLIRPDFVLWTGDTVYGYGDSPAELAREHSDFLEAAARGRSPLFNCPGNHEIHRPGNDPCAPQPSEREFEKHYGRLYGSFDDAGVHFIALDTAVPCQEDRIAGEQLDWLRRDLEANRGARAVFVFLHTEFFSSPRIDAEAGERHPALGNAAEIHQLFRQYPVRAVFSGHEHLYWREPAADHDGIEYFVAGGAGAPLYAPPDRGGFSHYLLVRLSGDRISYDVIEPGRLSVEKGAPAGAGGKRLWVVNSNDADIPVRGVEAAVPSAFGPCAALTAESTLERRDGTAVPVPVSVSSCRSRGGRRELTLSLTAPRGASVPLVIRKGR